MDNCFIMFCMISIRFYKNKGVYKFGCFFLGEFVEVLWFLC